MRSWQQRTGWALVAAGLLLLGWLGWELVGTTVLSQHRQGELVESLERDFAAAREPADLPRGAFAIAHLPDSVGGETVPIVEGDDDESLAWGLGHVTETERPGEIGNAVLGGHRITHGEPLRAMERLRPGDRIVVETARERLTYELPDDARIRRVPFTESAVLGDDAGDASWRAGSRLLTLVTCAELFHTDDRLVATAVLVERSER